MKARASGATCASAVAIAVGVATWVAVAVATHSRAAWDSDLYFRMALPAIGLGALALSALIPERVRRWASAPFAGPAAAAIVFAFFGAAACIPAWIGAALGRRLRGSYP